MKVKFANGVVRDCSAPIEQKVFRQGVDSGWVLNFRLNGGVTSAEMDSIVTPENIGSLDFFTTNENGEDKALFSLTGYEKITSSTIRHAEDLASAYAEIQLTKGV